MFFYKLVWDRVILEFLSVIEVEILKLCFEEINVCRFWGGLIVIGKGFFGFFFDFVFCYFVF